MVSLGIKLTEFEASIPCFWIRKEEKNRRLETQRNGGSRIKKRRQHCLYISQENEVGSEKKRWKYRELEMEKKREEIKESMSIFILLAI